jgi:DNA-binding NtrC family response regulator
LNSLLVLDDEHVVRQSFVDYFEDNLWRVIQAETAEQALQILEEEKPCAALVDIRLPGIDGNMFIREAIGRKLKMAFIICSGSPSYNVPLDLQQHMNVSSTFFRKPVANFKALEQDVIQTIKMAS